MNKTVKYSFKEAFLNNDGSFSHWVAPMSDPDTYEYAFDYLFDTPEEAMKYLREQIEEEILVVDDVNDWVLVSETIEVVSKVNL